ncbi:hypothetical protein DYB32_006740 [Aphanomyces invadans]|uniref:Uncharacterized protein n=1 Tax=Aphanomyces invadans TaxID=157072 RepID=A0A3R6V844_9STRA|nr:hypothetical protein DYB32_006740 [Aphanomyces invadans]
MGVNMGIKVMSKVLVAFPYHPQVLYWACLTLGNVACDYEPNQARGQKYHIVDCLVQSKITFILKLNSLEEAIEKETQLIARLAATAIGEEVRNEMDLHDHRRQSMFAAPSAATRIVTIRLGAAMEHWHRQSQKVLQGRIIRRFVNGMTEQTLYSAFRTWELTTRELRVEQSTLAYRAKQGLILDLSKKKRQERYRMLVDSK